VWTILLVQTALSGASLHELRATPQTCFWGFFDRDRPPVLRVRSGDAVFVETLTHQAGDAPDLLMDDGTVAVYDGVPAEARGPGVHIMTGPIAVEEARAGDTLEVRILQMEPRLAYGSNLAAWWGYLYDEFGKERITIYTFDLVSRTARAVFAFDYTGSPLYSTPGVIIPPDSTVRVPALPDVAVPLRPHAGVMGRFGGNIDNWRVGPGATMYYPVMVDQALFYVGDPHMAEGDGELSGTAIEASANILLRLIVRKDLSLESPLLETPTHWYTHGFDSLPLPTGTPSRPEDVGAPAGDLNAAMRMAAREMLAFLTSQRGLSRDDAYSLLSVAADFGITQVVDTRQGVHCSLPRSVFAAHSFDRS
jgi:acetamidase/formamidase